MDNPGGGLEPLDLIESMRREALITGRGDLEQLKDIISYAEDLQSELEEKTRALEGEKPTAMLFYYQPAFDDDMGSFALCAMTKVSNNGTVNLFAPRHEYLILYTLHGADSKITTWN